jgi:hypothetical protein
MRGKTGRVNPKRSREAYVGRNPSNLTAKLTLGLRLQVFETSWGWIASFNFRVQIAKSLKLHGLKVNFPHKLIYML